jgi:carbonic anhydrase
MNDLPELFANNRAWAQGITARDPDFFDRLSRQQSPRYLWIGCADSRVPANDIVGLLPGELFVHRNVANVVVHTDLNCLSVIQYAVDVLKVEHIIVCGHYGCGGVVAAWRAKPLGLIDNWLRHVQDVGERHAALLAAAPTEAAWGDRLCALNVLEQAINVCRTSMVRSAWERGQEVTVHGWIYRLQNGLLQNLGFNAQSRSEALEEYAAALAAISGISA